MKNKQNPFRVFRVFLGLFYKFWHNKKKNAAGKTGDALPF